MASFDHMRREYSTIVDAIENLENNRIQDLKQSLPEMQQEWRRAKDEFSERKQRLIDKETKKRMLEEIWQDRGEMPEEEEKEAEREMKLKKQAVTRTKKANQQRREQLRVQAQTVERGVAELKVKQVAVRALMERTEKLCREEEERQAKLAEQAAAVSRARSEVQKAEDEIREEEAESDRVRQQLHAVQAKSVEMRQLVQGVVEQCSTLEGQLERVSRDAQSLEAKEIERVGWYEQMKCVMGCLSGVRDAVVEGGGLRYDLASGHTLHVFLAPSGELAGASLLPESGVEINDLQAHAVRTNSLPFLLREVLARIGGLGAERKPQPSLAKPSVADQRAMSWEMIGVADVTPARGGTPPPPLPPPSSHRAPPVENLESRMSVAARAKQPTERADPSAPAASAVGGGDGYTPRPSRYGLRTRSTPSATPVDSAPPPAPPTEESTPMRRVRRASLAPSVADTLPCDEYKPQQVDGGESESEEKVRVSRRKHPSEAAAATRLKGTASEPPPAPPEASSTPALSSEMRVVAVDDARRARKSFARAVSHPRSPCSRAAHAGITMDAKQLLSGSRAQASRPQFTAIDAFGRMCAELTADGSFVGADGRTLGYFEADGSVGGSELQYLGKVSMPNDQSCVGYVTNNHEPEQVIALVDFGKATISTVQGSTLAELRKSGQVVSHLGATRGVLEGFDFHAMQAAAAFLVLIDPTFMKDE